MAITSVGYVMRWMMHDCFDDIVFPPRTRVEKVVVRNRKTRRIIRDTALMFSSADWRHDNPATPFAAIILDGRRIVCVPYAASDGDGAPLCVTGLDGVDQTMCLFSVSGVHALDSLTQQPTQLVLDVARTYATACKAIASPVVTLVNTGDPTGTGESSVSFAARVLQEKPPIPEPIPLVEKRLEQKAREPIATVDSLTALLNAGYAHLY